MSEFWMPLMTLYHPQKDCVSRLSPQDRPSRFGLVTSCIRYPDCSSQIRSPKLINKVDAFFILNTEYLSSGVSYELSTCTALDLMHCDLQEISLSLWASPGLQIHEKRPRNVAFVICLVKENILPIAPLQRFSLKTSSSWIAGSLWLEDEIWPLCTGESLV